MQHLRSFQLLFSSSIFQPPDSLFVALLRRAASRLTGIIAIQAVSLLPGTLKSQRSVIDTPLTAFSISALWPAQCPEPPCSRSRLVCQYARKQNPRSHHIRYGRKGTLSYAYVRSPCKWCAVWAGLCLPPERNKARSLTVRLKSTLKLIIASLPY